MTVTAIHTPTTTRLRSRMRRPRTVLGALRRVQATLAGALDHLALSEPDRAWSVRASDAIGPLVLDGERDLSGRDDPRRRARKRPGRLF